MSGEIITLPARPDRENVTFESCPVCGQSRPRETKPVEMPDELAEMFRDPEFARQFGALLDQVAAQC